MAKWKIKLHQLIIDTSNNLKNKLDKISLSPSNYSIMMSQDEIKLLERSVKNANQYLEFGCGGSTLHVLTKTSANIYSVESSKEWIEILSEYRLIRKERKNRLRFFPINIGEVKEWGIPVDDTHKDLFPHYSKSVFEQINGDLIDVALIDGRFRVACALSTILNCRNRNLKILIHDFWNRLEYYEILLIFLTEIERADTLGVFKVKDDINYDQVLKEYEAFKYVSV